MIFKYTVNNIHICVIHYERCSVFSVGRIIVNKELGLSRNVLRYSLVSQKLNVVRNVN